jgi:hypothetical protein
LAEPPLGGIVNGATQLGLYSSEEV